MCRHMLYSLYIFTKCVPYVVHLSALLHLEVGRVRHFAVACQHTVLLTAAAVEAATVVPIAVAHIAAAAAVPTMTVLAPAPAAAAATMLLCTSDWDKHLLAFDC